eukprot:gene9217-biopygen22695
MYVSRGRAARVRQLRVQRRRGGGYAAGGAGRCIASAALLRAGAALLRAGAELLCVGAELYKATVLKNNGGIRNATEDGVQTAVLHFDDNGTKSPTTVILMAGTGIGTFNAHPGSGSAAQRGSRDTGGGAGPRRVPVWDHREPGFCRALASCRPYDHFQFQK